MTLRGSRHPSLILTFTLALAPTSALAQEEDPVVQVESSPPPVPQDPISAPGAPPQYFENVIGRPSGLRADEAAAQAAAYSREAALQEERAKGAETKKSELTYRYVPEVNLTASYTRQSTRDSGGLFDDLNYVATPAAPGPLGPGAQLVAVNGDTLNFDPPPNVTYLNAEVIIPLSDYLLQMSQAYNGVDAEVKTAHLNEEAARLNAAAKARLHYYEWVRTRLRQVEAEQALQRARAQLSDLQGLAQAGQARRADVARQEVFIGTVTLGRDRAIAQEAIARKSLQVQMTGGDGPLPPWEIGENILQRRNGDGPPHESFEELYREASTNRLEIQALNSTAYSLSQQQHVQKSEGYPRLEGVGNLTYGNPNRRFVPLEQEWNGSWDIGVRLLFTINDLGTKGAQAERTEAEIAEVQLRRQQLEDELRDAIYEAVESLRDANQACETTRQTVPAAELAFNDRKELFDRGLSTAFELLDAETTLIKTRLELVDAHVSLRSARVRLDHVLGRK